MPGNDDIFINNIEELESLLSRAYWIEEEFEQVPQWDAFTKLNTKYRDIIFSLAHDSEKHKNKIKKMASNIKGIGVEAMKNNIGARNTVMLQKHFMDQEIMANIMDNDILALEIYTRIHAYTANSFIEEIWEGDDPEEFFVMLDDLIHGEKNHIELVKPHVGRIERIR